MITEPPPRRSAIRTLAIATVAALPIIPEIIRTSGWQAVPWIAAIGATATTISRILVMPGVDAWLRTYLPFLSTTYPYQGRHRLEARNDYPDNDPDSLSNRRSDHP